MSRSLSVRLTLLFLAVSLAGTLLAAILIRRHNERQFDRLVQRQAEVTIVRDVAAYYAARGNLQGLARLLEARYGAGPGGGPRRQLPFAVVNAAGEVVVPAGPWRRGEQLPEAALEEALPVTIDDVAVAAVVPRNLQPAREAFEQQYLMGVNRALFAGALGATAVAVLLGALLAQTLIRPLREMAAASHAMAEGELGRQVPVRSQDELGDLAQAFNSMSRALADATRQRRQMTADIAHDLRTPLTVLAGYLEAMEEGALAATPERLGVMQQEVGGLMRLVEDLRTLSLADAGELTLDRERTDPAALLEQVHAAHRPRAEQKGVALELAAVPGLPPVTVDPERMRQVLGNLLANALRHTPAGGRIALGAAPGDSGRGGVQLWVADSGSGIAAQDLPHIFDRFYRADAARSGAEGASGLGLAIVRSVVEMHGGRVTVESEPGRGTRFEIWLPAGEAA